MDDDASMYVASTEEELAEFQEIFNLVDLDKGGTISKDELKQLMNTLGLKPTQEELNQMVDEIDADGNGEIDFPEFLTMMLRKMNEGDPEKELRDVFTVFDKDQSGELSIKELRELIYLLVLLTLLLMLPQET